MINNKIKNRRFGVPAQRFPSVKELLVFRIEPSFNDTSAIEKKVNLHSGDRNKKKVKHAQSGSELQKVKHVDVQWGTNFGESGPNWRFVVKTIFKPR